MISNPHDFDSPLYWAWADGHAAGIADATEAVAAVKAATEAKRRPSERRRVADMRENPNKGETHE